MGQRVALTIGMLLAIALAGCQNGKAVHTTAWLDRFRQLGAPTGPDLVIMDVALIERPIGDAYINRDLWDVADEQVVALEKKAALEDNGFRIGQIGGITPVGLQSLLTAERSCADPRRIHTHAKEAKNLALGPAAYDSRFHVMQNGEIETVVFDQAEFNLEVVPELMPDGRTRLRFTPFVYHGETSLVPCPAPDRSGWMLQEKRPLTRYEKLSWEVELAPNDYVVIGARFDRPDTLGHECFVRPDGPGPVQRMLVIRTGRLSPGMPNEEPHPATAGEQAIIKSPPLACQAAMTTIRGTSP